MGGKKRFSKFVSLLMFSLMVSLTFTPLMLPLPQVKSEKPQRETQQVRYDRARKAGEPRKKAERAEKVAKFDAAHQKLRRDVELMAPYWTVGGGFESTLVLDNTLQRSIEVTPVVYAHDGRRLQAKTITLGKLASETSQGL